MSFRGQYRHLTLRHEHRILTNHVPDLLPGEARFHSFYLPSLTAGKHTIKVTQTVKPPTDDSRHKDAPHQHAAVEQKFDVLAPEWALSSTDNSSSSSNDDTAVVMSVFPAPGHTAQFRTLPHMVLRDPHLPWARRVSKQKLDDSAKNAIPWFALIAFTEDELQLSPDDATAFFPEATGASLNENLGWDIKAGKIERVGGQDRLLNGIKKPGSRDQTTQTSVIAVPGELFKTLFKKEKKFESEEEEPRTCDVAKFRFLSHVRSVATDGTMSAIEGEPGTFGIVISHRTGPVNVDSPTPVMLHLVSLQGIDGLELKDVKERVLMTSLYSWSYTALPPDSEDTRTAFRHIGTKDEGISILRTDRTSDAPSASDLHTRREPPSVEELVTKRQNDGYTLVRHRTQTGEQTAAIYRGPLVPKKVKHPLHKEVHIQSNFGSDLQILDKEVGLMDISYASAWQLGKTLALGDPAFTAALARLRTLMHEDALDKAKKDASKTPGTPGKAYRSRSETVAAVAKSLDSLNDINRTLHATGTTAVSTNRWKRREPTARVNLNLSSDHIFSQMYDQALKVSEKVATAVDGGPYNYHTVPSNTDYAAIQEWVLDKLHLAGIPAHYFLPDPSYLPEETLRFFHVDENWTDALVDGALSLANHYTSRPEEDFCRSALKAQLNKYLITPIKDLGYCQQMPAYGFLLRSQLLVQFPDLAVSAVFQERVQCQEDWGHVKPKPPILVQRRLATDVMLVLFDREPPELTKLQFTLPAHQQTFVVAAEFVLKDPVKGITEDQIVIEHSKIYATETPETRQDVRREWLGGEAKSHPMDKYFDWKSHTMHVSNYALEIHKFLAVNMNKKTDQDMEKTDQYVEKHPTSAVLALQLNEPIYTLEIVVNPSSDSNSLKEWEILPKERPSSFRFHPPPFPAHKYAPTTPLPEPLEMTRFEAITIQQPEPLPVIPVARPPSTSVAESSPSSPQTRVGDPTPVFEFTISPVQDQDFIPTNRPVPPDLIFGIRVGENSLGNFEYRLTKLEVRVPLGEKDDKNLPDPEDNFKPRPLLCRSADEGPPPTMLSNMRFNVLRRWDNETDELVLEVVPRTSYGVNMLTLKEASFILPMAAVIPWKVPYDPRVGKERNYLAVAKLQSQFFGSKHGEKLKFNHPPTTVWMREE